MMVTTLGAQVTRIPGIAEERKWKWIRLAVFIAIWTASGVGSFFFGMDRCRRDMRADLVKKGFATWIVIDELGHSEFKLKEKP